ncbi:MAG: hypothetical protein AAF960_20740 [Bacteroidota bacterium]
MAELKYTKHLLKKLETLFEEIGYTVRYAKGTFNSGYCIVENQKVAVINKFFDTEGRIGVLVDILLSIDINKESFSEKSLKTYKQVTASKTTEEAE